MPIKRRLAVAIAVLILILAVYGTIKLYSPLLTFYVVEQTLIQKAPPGTDPALLHERLQLIVSASPTSKARMEELFRISAYLEKVQTLTPEQLEFLIRIPLFKSDSFRKDPGEGKYFANFPTIWNFSLIRDV
jgi:hypothetical protein